MKIKNAKFDIEAGFNKDSTRGERIFAFMDFSVALVHSFGLKPIGGYECETLITTRDNDSDFLIFEQHYDSLYIKYYEVEENACDFTFSIYFDEADKEFVDDILTFINQFDWYNS